MTPTRPFVISACAFASLIGWPLGAGILEQFGGRGSDLVAAQELRAPDEVRPVPQELASILGTEVRSRGEEISGRIIDVLADSNGKVRAAVLELGGFLGIGTRKIVVEWKALTFDTKDKQTKIIVEMDRAQLRAAPEYKPAQPVVGRTSE